MFFLPLVKADAEKRLVFARAAMEEPDKSREIMDYVSARPQFEAWSKQYSDATLGKSLGNIRAMHNPRHLAGKVQDIIYDDANKTVDVCLKVLDPVDWAKVEEGGYTGLSIGGGYIRKWSDTTDPTLTRYTPRIAEISLVDSPCMPSARIMELQKSEGETVEVLLKGVPRLFDDLKPPPTFDDLNKLGFHPIQSLKEGGMADLTGSNSIHYGYLHGLFSDLPKTRAARLLANQKKPKTPQSPKPPTAPMGPAKQEAEGDLGKVGFIPAVYGAGGAFLGHNAGQAIGARVGRKLGQRAFQRSTKSLSFVDPRHEAAAAERGANTGRKIGGAVGLGVGASAGSGLGEYVQNREAKSRQRRARKQELDFGPLLEKNALTTLAKPSYTVVRNTMRHLGQVTDSYASRGKSFTDQNPAELVRPEWSHTNKQKKFSGEVEPGKRTSYSHRGKTFTSGEPELTRSEPIGFDNLLEKAKTSPEEREKIRLTMHEFKHGQLRSYRSNLPKRKMPHVTNRRQAIAIALNQARRMGKQDEASIFESILTKRDASPPQRNRGDKTDQMPAAHGGNVEAIKARWIKEAHHDLDDHFSSLMSHAGKAVLGQKEKVASVKAQRDNAWHAVGDAQDAYDKVRPHLPPHHSLMMEVPHMGGLLYNPEGVGEGHFHHTGKPHAPIHLLHPLEANDWVKKHGKGKVSKSEPLGLITHIRQITERAATA